MWGAPKYEVDTKGRIKDKDETNKKLRDETKVQKQAETRQGEDRKDKIQNTKGKAKIRGDLNTDTERYKVQISLQVTSKLSA